MPALTPTDHWGEITWLGLVPEGECAPLQAEVCARLTLGWDGAEGDRHSGRWRLACPRVSAQHKPGTRIANTRQLSILCADEIAATARALGLAGIDPGLLGATVVLRGVPDFTHVPPGARLQADNGATLVIDMENLPCSHTARSVADQHNGAAPGYKAAARGRRGVTAWVERPGTLAVGDRMRLHIPAQRAWQPG